MCEADYSRFVVNWLSERQYPVIGTEVRAMSGIVDVACITKQTSWTNEMLSALATPSCAIVMRVLSVNGPSSAEVLSQLSGLAMSTVRRVSTRLVKQNLATEAGGRFSLLTRNPKINGELWAIEVKLSDWRQALYQAVRCKQYADRVFVAMPAEKAPLLRKQRGYFDPHGVGVLLLERDGSVSTLWNGLRFRNTCSAQKLFVVAGLLSSVHAVRNV